MRDFLFFIPITVFYLSFKTTVTPGLPLPDITVLIAFYAASTRPSLAGPFLAFVLGYIEDVFYGSVIGTRSFALVAVYALTYLSTIKFHFDTPYLKAAAGAVLALCKGVLAWLILRSVGTAPSLLTFAIPIAAMTGLFAPVITALFDKLPLKRAFERGMRDEL